MDMGGPYSRTCNGDRSRWDRQPKARVLRRGPQQPGGAPLLLKNCTGNGSVACIWSPISTLKVRSSVCASAPPWVGFAFDDHQPGISEYNVN